MGDVGSRVFGFKGLGFRSNVALGMNGFVLRFWL